MNICFITATYHPVIGGGETYVKTLAEGLARYGEKITVISDYISGSQVSERVNDVQVYRCRNYNKMLYRKDKIKWEQMYFSILEDIAGFLNEKKVDIIHTNSFETSIIGSFISSELGIPHVCTYHEVCPEQEAFGVGKCKVIFRNANISAYVAGSKFYYDKAIKFGADKEKVNLIYHGVDIEKFKNAFKPDSIGEKNEVILLCVARIKERKGIKELIEAVYLLKRQIKKLKLIICGTTNSGSEQYFNTLLEIIRNLHLEDAVSIYTNISHDDIIDFYRKADIVVQPSYYEGLGIAILEGMASRKPIIACNTVGINEILINGINGLLIKPKDVKSIVEAIETLSVNKALREKIVDNGYNTINKNFSIDRMLCETRKLYSKLLISYSK